MVCVKLVSGCDCCTWVSVLCELVGVLVDCCLLFMYVLCFLWRFGFYVVAIVCGLVILVGVFIADNLHVSSVG